MEKMKRFIDVYVSTEICNLQCTYCYVSQTHRASQKIGEIGHKAEVIRQALSVKRLGGICLLNFCGGGETLLGEDILPVIKALLEEGHYVQIVTNGTVTRRFLEIAEWNERILKRLFLKFSFHFLELKKRNLIGVFFENVKLTKSAGCSFSIEIMPHDELVPHIEEIKKICLKNVYALPHVTVGRDENSKEFKVLTQYSTDEYKQIWNTFESKMFDYKMSMIGEKRREICYAGEWSFSLRIDTGDLYQCNGGLKVDNIFTNISAPLKFKIIGDHCPHTYCYNCHAYVTMGVVPNLAAPLYAEMRDRKCINGTNWIAESVRDFFSQKFKDNNIVYLTKKEKYRVLLIGDSIREGYSKYVEEELCGFVDVVQIPENGKFSGYVLRMLHDWSNDLQIGTDIDLVYWNVGLWDVVRIYGDEPLTDIVWYIENLNRIVFRMQALFPNAKLYFAKTTPVLEEKNTDIMYLRRNDDIAEYNHAACAAMERLNIEVDDLHKIVKSFPDELYLDGTHLSEAGNRYVGHHIAEKLFTTLFCKEAISESPLQYDLQHFLDKKIVIYGYGNYGRKLISQFKTLNIPIWKICDSNKFGHIVEGQVIINPEQLINCSIDQEDILIIIAISNIVEYERSVKNLKDKRNIGIVHYSSVMWL